MLDNLLKSLCVLAIHCFDGGNCLNISSESKIALLLLIFHRSIALECLTNSLYDIFQFPEVKTIFMKNLIKN